MAASGSARVQSGQRVTAGRQIGASMLTSGPGIGWVTVFLLVPLLAVGVISFMTRGTLGGFERPFTAGNYTRLFGFGLFGFDPLYPLIIGRSLVLGTITTVACLAAAFPLAFFVAAQPEGRRRNLALTLVVIPFWTNLLIRTYAWQILFAPDGRLARIASAAGLIDAGTGLYPGTFAVTIGMLCAYLPFLVLPLYAAVEKIDWSLAEAASDLGADRMRVFRHAILPQVAPGLAAGIILVFIPATGQFVIPDLLGGAKTVMLGNAIQQQFGASRDWPFGSAIACAGMALVMLGLLAWTRVSGQEGEGML